MQYLAVLPLTSCVNTASLIFNLGEDIDVNCLLTQLNIATLALETAKKY